MLIIEPSTAVQFCRQRRAEECLFELSRIWRCIGQEAPLHVRLLREMIIFRDLDYPSLGSFRTVSFHSFIFSWCEAEAETVKRIGILNHRHEFAPSQRNAEQRQSFCVFFSLFKLWRSEKVVGARNSQISDLHLMKVIGTQNGVKLASFRAWDVKNIDIW